MTDLERLRETFTALGLPYRVALDEEVGKPETRQLWVEIQAGRGHYGFFGRFYFDAAGKFTGHGLWE